MLSGLSPHAPSVHGIRQGDGAPPEEVAQLLPGLDLSIRHHPHPGANLSMAEVAESNRVEEPSLGERSGIEPA